MKWTFETSLTVFLILVALSQVIAVKSKHRISIQFTLGLFFIIGYALELFPANMIEMSKMKDVGFIAFNVLIIHSGTMLDLRALKRTKNIVGLGFCSALIMIAVVGLGLQPFLGTPVAWISAAPMIGGGATSAIASVSIMKAYPYLSALPWILFMIQSFFCIPLLNKALRNEASQFASNAITGPSVSIELSRKEKRDRRSEKESIINREYKHTAYYLATLMIVSVLNQFAIGFVPGEIPIHPAMTALILGCLLGHIGLLDRSPLSRSDSFGFLMLGLMSLMCHTLAFAPLDAVVKMLIPAIIVFVVGASTLWIAGGWLGPYFGMSRSKGQVVAVSSMAGMPLAAVLVDETARNYAITDAHESYIQQEMKPTVIATGLWITNAFSILCVSVVMIFLS